MKKKLTDRSKGLLVIFFLALIAGVYAHFTDACYESIWTGSELDQLQKNSEKHRKEMDEVGYGIKW